MQHACAVERAIGKRQFCCAALAELDEVRESGSAGERGGDLHVLQGQVQTGRFDSMLTSQLTSSTAQLAAHVEHAQSWPEAQLVHQFHRGRPATDVELVDRCQLIVIQVLRVRTDRGQHVKNLLFQSPTRIVLRDGLLVHPTSGAHDALRSHPDPAHRCSIALETTPCAGHNQFTGMRATPPTRHRHRRLHNGGEHGRVDGERSVVEERAMPKRLVVCCDGTWNTPDQLGGGRPAPTNVTRVALSVTPKDFAGRDQRIFYHRGVGTNRGERIRGGVFGFGLSRNVRDTYRFLVQAFEPGDELFFFGFSRGAFTARSTVGFVRNCGILRRARRPGQRGVCALSQPKQPHPTAQRRGAAVQALVLLRDAHPLHRRLGHRGRPRHSAQWATSGQSAQPPMAVSRHGPEHDRRRAFQALAIDEKRRPFRPTIWKQQANAVGQRLEQVWFAGVHSDVGGGYPDPALAEIALRWMVDRASACGLVFEADAFAPLPPGADEALRHTGRYVVPDALGQLHESRTGCYRLLPPLARSLGVTDHRHEYVASSAIERHRRMPAYAPPGLVTYLDRAHQVTQV